MCVCESERKSESEKGILCERDTNENNGARDEERVRSGGNPEFKIKIMLFVNAQGVPGLSDLLASELIRMKERKRLL